MTSVHTPLKPISNGSNSATFPAQLPPPLQMLPAKTKTSQARSCLRCHGALPAHSSKKWCELCRQRHREASNAVRQGHAARAKGASAFIQVLINTVTPARQVASPYVDADVTMADAKTGGPSASASPSRSNPGATKRKADVMDSETSAERDQPCEDVALHSTVQTEYQTGKDLFDGLSRDVEASRVSRTTSSRPQYVNFHGSYFIVMNPGICGERRVKGAVDEFRLSGKLRFGNLVKRESEKSCGGHARTFWCACDPPPPPLEQPTPSPATQDASPSAKPASSQASARPKRTQTTVVGWLAKEQSKEQLDDEGPPLPPPGCGGTITVSAVTDFSHPLGRMGIQGQKMTVRVEHPGRDFKRVLEW